MDILGVPIVIWHSLIVEEPTGISVFVILILAGRVLTDIAARGKPPSPRVEKIRQASDYIAYSGSVIAVLFLILSGITGYLIQPYSSLIAQPILVNIAILALAALFFWSAFVVLRFVSGPDLWSHRGLYLLAIVTATLALIFDALAASVGAELSLGGSALEPVYQALNFSWRTFTIQPLDLEITLGLVIVGIVVGLLALFRSVGPASDRRNKS
jgi:hypothetical protein